MSLINKMLRDLDARHAGTGQTVLPNEVRPLPEEVVAPRVSRRVWVLAGLAILSAAAIQTSTIWLPLLAEFVPLPPSLLPPPPVVAPAAQPAPTTVVLQLPPPEQMLPLPSLPDTPPAAPDASAGQVPPPAAGQQAPAVAATPQPPLQVAENRSTDLKIDRSLPEVQVKPAAPAPVPAAPVAAPPPRKAAPAPKPDRGQATAKIEKQQNLATPQERAEAIYRKGVAAYRVGHYGEAAALFKSALQEDPRHLTTRQTLLSMQAEQKQWDDVQVILREGLELMPEQISWAMALARIQVERGRLPEAWDTLQKYMPNGEKSADYQGFAGVLLQRMRKPHEATFYYQAAVQLKPNEGRWWLGLGLALEADGKAAEAREAFQRARNSGGVTPEMAAAIDRKLR